MRAGEFECKGVRHEFGQTSKGSDYVRVFLKLKIDGAVEESTWDGFFTEKTEARTIEALRFLGCTFPNDDITNLDGLGSKVAKAVVEDEKQLNGSFEPKVRWINDPNRAVAQSLDDSGKAQLRARLRGQVAAARMSTGQPKPAATKPPNGARPAARVPESHQREPGEDEVPF